MAVTSRRETDAAVGSVSSTATKKSASVNAKYSSGDAAPSGEQILAEGREALRQSINDYGIKRVPKGSHELWPLKDDPFYGGDNTFYIWQFYLRRCLLEPRHLFYIARVFWATYKPCYLRLPFQICGVEQAAIPILTALLMTAPSVGINLHAFTVRKERKKFGLKNIIEGAPNPNLPVVFVDDLTSPTHATLWHFIRTMGEARLQIYPRCFVVVYKGKREELKDIPTTLGNLGIDCIFTLQDFAMTYEDYHANKIKLGTPIVPSNPIAGSA